MKLLGSRAIMRSSRGIPSTIYPVSPRSSKTLVWHNHHLLSLALLKNVLLFYGLATHGHSLANRGSLHKLTVWPVEVKSHAGRTALVILIAQNETNYVIMSCSSLMPLKK